jgi:hypothetical protein
MLQSLADIPADHLSLFGESRVINPEPLVMEENATVLPRVTIRGQSQWALGHSQGVFNANGDHIEALNDMRANRRMFYPANRLEDAAGFNDGKARKLKFMLYGGTLYEHFGDMLVDTNRAYQLLRLFRHSNEPIWFHYAVSRNVLRSLETVRVDYLRQWLDCLGLADRFRLIRRPMQPKQLVSCGQIYRDLRFISSDYPAAARAALEPKLKRRLRRIQRQGQRIAYFSRHKLNKGTTKFIQEAEVVEKIRTIPEVDIIHPEELSFEEKLSLWRSHAYIVGFPQGCMMLKPFVPHTDLSELAQQIFLLAGRKSFPSTWLNVEKACHFGDHYLDCHGEPTALQERHTHSEDDSQLFDRANSIDVGVIVHAIESLAASLR